MASQDWQSEETNGFHPNEATHVPNYPTECQGTHEGLCTEGAAAASETIVIGCDCVESGGECGTWLELSPDGILAVEDKDGERLSIMLPLWLDQVIRHAFAQQPAVENC